MATKTIPCDIPGSGGVTCCFRGAKQGGTNGGYSPVQSEPIASEWLESRLTDFVSALCQEWSTALPLVQVWLPKKSTTAQNVFLSTEECPFVISDPAMAAFRKRSTEMVYCKGQGLPGRVWISGAAEVVQDHNFANPAHYTQRGLFLSQGISESIGIPIFAPSSDASSGSTAICKNTTLRSGSTSDQPAAVLEVLLADGKANAKAMTTDGRYLLHAGGSAALISSVSAHLESVGLSLCPQHHSSRHEECSIRVPWKRVSAEKNGKVSPDTPPNSFFEVVRSNSEFSSCVLVSAGKLTRTPSCRSISSADSSMHAAEERPLAASFDTTTGASFRGSISGGGSQRANGGHRDVRLSAELPRVTEALGENIPPRWQPKPFTLLTTAAPAVESKPVR